MHYLYPALGIRARVPRYSAANGNLAGGGGGIALVISSTGAAARLN